MDPATVFCPNLVCHARGQIGQGNIGIHAQKGSVSNVDITTPMPLIYKTLFSSISTFETPPL